LGRCRLPTSADWIRGTGTPIERRYPHPHRIVAPLTGLVVLLRWRTVFGSEDPPVFAMSQFDSIEGANLQYPGAIFLAEKPGLWSRSGSTEPSEGLALGECPSSCFPVGHPLSPTRCCERIGVSSAAPRVTPPFESPVMFGLSSWPSSSFRRLPRRRTLFRRPRCLSPFRHPFRCLRIAPHALFGLGLRVTPPCLGSLSRPLPDFLFIRVALQRGVPAPFLSALRAPKP
jgi:hypothetical protein